MKKTDFVHYTEVDAGLRDPPITFCLVYRIVHCVRLEQIKAHDLSVVKCNSNFLFQSTPRTATR